MDEGFEAEKIHLLEDRIKLFDKPTNGDGVTPGLILPILMTVSTYTCQNWLI